MAKKPASYYDDARKARGDWDKENGYYIGYEKAREGRCLSCIHFSINHDHIEMGSCNKIKAVFQETEFAKKGASDHGVSTLGVCENYTSSQGIGLDGKVIMPQLLPLWEKTRKDEKTGEIFVVA